MEATSSSKQESGPNRKDHNELEKKRRLQLDDSYDQLRKHVKRHEGRCSGGRDKTLEVANSLAMKQLDQLEMARHKAQQKIEAIQAEAANASGEKLEFFNECIKKLMVLKTAAVPKKPGDAKTDYGGDDDDDDDGDDGYGDDDDDDDDDAIPDSSCHVEE